MDCSFKKIGIRLDIIFNLPYMSNPLPPQTPDNEAEPMHPMENLKLLGEWLSETAAISLHTINGLQLLEAAPDGLTTEELLGEILIANERPTAFNNIQLEALQAHLYSLLNGGYVNYNIQTQKYSLAPDFNEKSKAVAEYDPTKHAYASPEYTKYMWDRQFEIQGAYNIILTGVHTGASEENFLQLLRSLDELTGPTGEGLSHTFDFGRYRKVYDVAGGTGAIALKINQSLENNLHSELNQIVVIDTKGVVDNTTLPYATEVAEDYVGVVKAAIDLKTESLPEIDENSCIMMNNFLHVLSLEEQAKFIKYKLANVPTGTELMITDFPLNDDGTYDAPLGGCLPIEFNTLTMGGSSFKESEMIALLESSGWKYIQTVGVGIQKTIVAVKI